MKADVRSQTSENSLPNDRYTPEKRRAWIESVSGLGGRNKEFEKLAELMRPLMTKKDVVAAVQKIINEKPVEKEGVLWIRKYHFTFDDKDRLETGPNLHSSGGGIRIGSGFERGSR